MDREKQANLLREAATMVDQMSVSGADKQKAIAVIQALMQLAGDIAKPEAKEEAVNG